MNHEYSPEELEAIERARQEAAVDFIDEGAVGVQDHGTTGERIHLSDEQLDRMQGVNADEDMMKKFEGLAAERLPKNKLSDASVDSALDGMEARLRERARRPLSPETAQMIAQLNQKRNSLVNYLKAYPSGSERDEKYTTIYDVGQAIVEDTNNYSNGLIEEKHLLLRLQQQARRLRRLSIDLDIESEDENV